jgi:rfaE bifunctional protein kinase chain/domain
MHEKPALSVTKLRQLVERFSRIRVAVIGDFFLDQYLVCDQSLEETSLETGLPAHQIVEIRHSPGAAGTVVNNLHALGAGSIFAVGVIGADGNGFELRRELEARHVHLEYLHTSIHRKTPTYMKPVHRTAEGTERELSRLDIHNRGPLTEFDEQALRASIQGLVGRVDAIMVLDQVAGEVGGVVTSTVRNALSDLKKRMPNVPILADSRSRIGLFHGVMLKPNADEAYRATGLSHANAAITLARQTGECVFLTLGAQGMLLAKPDGTTEHVPGFSVSEPTDPTGAGDSASAGILLGLAAGATAREAATLGNLVASLTVRQLRTTGVATPDQLLSHAEGVLSLQ